MKAAEAEALVDEFMPYAYKVAHEFSKTRGMRHPGVDIDGAANEAMAEALRTWKKGRGASFKTWLTARVCYRIRDAWRSAYKYRCNSRGEIVKLHSIEGYLDKMTVNGVDHPLCAILPPVPAVDVESQMEGVGEACARLERQMGVCFSLRERDVLIAYIEYGTLKRAAEYLGVSESRVCQIVGDVRRRCEIALSN